ncbi:MAG: hypothetical protein LBE10_04935 [Treponema sp.]|jgi:hypothetical protein|nr:hypothetical protein [Treponema sp.]
MKTFSFRLFALVFLGLMSVSCKHEAQAGSGAERAEIRDTGAAALNEAPAVSLEELAETERAGTWLSGMGLLESSIREAGGDFGGALIAAYRELAVAYSRGLIVEDALAEGLRNVLENPEFRREGREDALKAAEGIMEFRRGNWHAAAERLKPFAAAEDPDSFVHWLLLVCEIEGGLNGEGRRAVYSSLRSRHGFFPEYWRRGMDYFSSSVSIAASYAENCINLAPDGPFASDCRYFLAVQAGLSENDGEALKTKAEMETLIRAAIAGGNPLLLADLFPLIALQDNSYTFTALALLDEAASRPLFRDWFSSEADRAQGRLADRLKFLCRDQGRL